MLKHYIFKTVIHLRKRGRERPFGKKTLLKKDSRDQVGHGTQVCSLPE